MFERNNAEVLAVVTDWLSEQLGERDALVE
jgi:hypothetical protein